MATITSFASLVLRFALVVLPVHADKCAEVIYLKMGDVDKAGTDAHVSLKLLDIEGYYVGESDLQTTGLMGSGYDYFERNHLDLFAFKSPCLSNSICKIELSHDNTGDFPGWYVEYVNVTVSSSNGPCTQREFQINQWLSLDEPPHSLHIIIDLCAFYGLNNMTNNHDLAHLILSKSA